MKSITVKIPRNHIRERRYTIDCLFNNILGIPYSIEYGKDGFCDFIIGLKSIRFTDSFWVSEDDVCYTSSRLPIVQYGYNQFCAEKDIPILYGNNCINIGENTIYCEIDILASVFFMLSRWEEYVNENKDEHLRFSIKESIAFKYGFHHRPIVNEYAEMLWNMLLYLGCTLKRKSFFSLQLTHDIDFLSLQNKAKTLLKNFAWDIIKRKKLFHAFDSLLKSLCRDPYDLFDFFMDQSELAKVKSHFFFMSAGALVKDYDDSNYLYTRRFRKTIERIIQRNHYIGFHPSYFAFKDSITWYKEFNVLQKVVPIKIIEARQHYLRVSLPESLTIWDGYISVDSSLGYADGDGFRCGTGNTYPLFDLSKMQILSIHEMPLILMDTTMVFYLNLSVEESRNKLFRYISLANKYQMPITFLFHNNFYGYKWEGWKQLYKDMINHYCQIKNDSQ